MRRSIATVSISGTLDKKLEAIASARFDGVEIFENDLLYFGGSPRDVRAIASDLGLEIYLYQPFRDLDSQDPARFRRNMERAKRKLDIMEQLGAPLMLVCSNVTAGAADPDLAAEQLRELAELAAERSLRVGYEALAWGRKVRTYRDAWAIVERADHPHLGLILDSFHTLALDDDLAPMASIPGDRIAFVQIADAPRLSLDVLSWSRHYRCFPGQGALAVDRFTAAALQAGYTGPLSLEVFNDEFRASPNRPTAIDGMRSLLHLEESVRKIVVPAAGAGERPARQVQGVDLFDPPPPPPLKGVAFVEFAVDDASEPKLRAWLEALGFRSVGRHRTKRVSLLRQNDVNLVLNAERTGFAHSFFLLHGPSVCAIGLGVEDPVAAIGRAEAFKSHRVAGRVNPHETVIPAIRAGDGYLVYFVADQPGHATALDNDFVMEPGSAEGTSEAGGLRSIDHISHVLPKGQLDSWILFLRTTLGMVPEDAVVLPDPHGLVHSRTMRTPDRVVRFPLNISDDLRTTTARSVSTFMGAAAHHIALATDDVFAAVERFRAAGAAIMPIPANYYDDLPARFDLAPELVDRLQASNVLYDQDDTGAFLNAYTLPFEDRFFFEFVQRQGGYQGYGAANAPIRMAAQAQQHARLHPDGLPRV
ncbi:MAG: sugar phosphate isomerase/epimerase and 4-hydroxyphenylpyruvate domain-containing protein [Alphaproteobacteria bacterium]|nr:sugar phosphate isomerase/epimerase and 4-hydroxyphenylpyruvate domain-containing protein [Alphaproteobacteria bacterium]